MNKVEVNIYIYHTNVLIQDIIKIGKKFNILNDSNYAYMKNKWCEDIIHDKDKLSTILDKSIKQYQEYELVWLYETGMSRIFLEYFLENVSIISLQFNADLLDKNKNLIKEIIEEAEKIGELILADAHPLIYNPYHERAYGRMDIGAYWQSWIGTRLRTYFGDDRIRWLNEQGLIQDMNDTFTHIQLVPDMDLCESEEFKKLQRKFMKQMKLDKVVFEYNKRREFREID